MADFRRNASTRRGRGRPPLDHGYFLILLAKRLLMYGGSERQAARSVICTYGRGTADHRVGFVRRRWEPIVRADEPHDTLRRKWRRLTVAQKRDLYAEARAQIVREAVLSATGDRDDKEAEDDAPAPTGAIRDPDRAVRELRALVRRWGKNR